MVCGLTQPQNGDHKGTLRTSPLQKGLKVALSLSVHDGFQWELRLLRHKQRGARIAKGMLLVRPLMRRIEELTSFLD